MKRIAVLALAATTFLSAPAVASDLDEARVKELVLEVIRENPEIVREAIAILQAEEDAAKAEAAAVALSERRDILENDPNAPVLGNPDGDITIVEFFDYNCGYCRRVFSNVHALVDSDPNIRVVMREWPILGEESVFAARASLAARKQGKYEEFHNALMGGRGRANEASVMQLASELGMDVDQLRRDMEAPEVVEHLQTSQQLTQVLGLNGTPAFVFGNQLVPGAIELDQMKELIQMQRERG